MTSSLLTPHTLKAVLFDLDGTLYQHRPAALDCFYQQARSAGAEVQWNLWKGVQRWAHRYWARSEELAQDLAVYQSLTADFWLHYTRRQLGHFGCPAPQAEALAPQVAERMLREFTPEAWVDPDTPAMLQTLRQAGLLLAVVSNRGHAFGEELRQLKLDSYFDFALAAGEVHSWKPDPGIYRHTLAYFNLEPEQALYVGDNYYADIVGAHNVGLTGVLLDPEEIFPDADCTVIQRLPQVLELLQ